MLGDAPAIRPAEPSDPNISLEATTSIPDNPLKCGIYPHSDCPACRAAREQTGRGEHCRNTETERQRSGGTKADRDNKWLIDLAELARLTSLSVRHLRRLDSSRDIPGRVVVGRRVLFQTEIAREWVRAGLPGRDQWAALLKRNNKR